MEKARPILFNTDMVRAILGGRKTATRRCIRNIPDGTWRIGRGVEADIFYAWSGDDIAGSSEHSEKKIKSPYKPGDILYVRETWRMIGAVKDEAYAHIEYKAGGQKRIILPNNGIRGAGKDADDSFIDKWMASGNWHPSIHMPKEAARIWLEVTEARAERLQEITFEGCLEEGAFVYLAADGYFDREVAEAEAKKKFSAIWDATARKTDICHSGWDANPWVWVTEFKKCRKPGTGR